MRSVTKRDWIECIMFIVLFFAAVAFSADFGIVCIPGRSDGSGLDAEGNPITHPSSRIHNGGEYSLVLADGTTNSYADLLSLPGTTTNASGAITSLYLTN